MLTVPEGENFSDEDEVAGLERKAADRGRVDAEGRLESKRREERPRAEHREKPRPESMQERRQREREERRSGSRGGRALRHWENRERMLRFEEQMRRDRKRVAEAKKGVAPRKLSLQQFRERTAGPVKVSFLPSVQFQRAPTLVAYQRLERVEEQLPMAVSTAAVRVKEVRLEEAVVEPAPTIYTPAVAEPAPAVDTPAAAGPTPVVNVPVQENREASGSAITNLERTAERRDRRHRKKKETGELQREVDRLRQQLATAELRLWQREQDLAHHLANCSCHWRP